MKKWQTITIIVVGLLLVAGLAGGTYWYIAGQKMPAEIKASDKPTTKSQEDKDLDAVKSDLEGDDLDMTELDNISTELESIDLSEV